MTNRHEAALRAALDERDRRAQTFPWVRVPDADAARIVEAALAAEWSHPHYTSTYCIHELHNDCRLTCKACEAPCRCECHSALAAENEHKEPWRSAECARRDHDNCKRDFGLVISPGEKTRPLAVCKCLCHGTDT